MPQRTRRDVPEAPDAQEQPTGTPGPVLAAGALVVVRVDRASLANLEVPCKVGGGLERRLVGTIDATQIQDEWTDSAPLERFTPGQFVKARVLHTSPHARSRANLPLSTREGLVSGKVSVDQELKEAEAVPEVGALVTGYVHQTGSKGCFIRISRLLTARVELRNLADGFVMDVAKEFPPGKLVAGRVIKVEDRKVELTLKRSAVIAASEQKWALDSMQPGTICDGVVKNIATCGVFVRLNAGVDALCRNANAVDGNAASAATTYGPGDVVKCLIMGVDAKGRVQIGLKPSLFTHVPVSELANTRAVWEQQEITPVAVSDEEEEEEEEEKDEGEDAKQNAEMQGKKKARTSRGDAVLSLQDALRAVDVPDPLHSLEASAAAEEDAEDADAPLLLRHRNKLNPQRREALRERRFQETRALEEKLASDAPPETTEDVERLLVAQPNSSELYIRLMAMHVALTELDQARAAGERALRTISFRQEDEKRNVWRALIQLEVDYGTESSLQTLFRRMVQENDAKWAHLVLVDALASKAASSPEAQRAVDDALRGARKATKGRSLKVWMRAVELKFDWDQAGQGRALFKDALKSIPVKKHCKALLRLGRLEYTHAHGDIEKGRTVLEGVVANFPKRTDAWHIYIDLEVKFGQADKARALFSRVVNVHMPVKRAKAFFKKWLDWETEDDAKELVKAEARRFVEAHS